MTGTRSGAHYAQKGTVEAYKQLILANTKAKPF